MRTINLNEIIPNTLYQRGQFVTFPFATKMAMLERYNIDMVVNLWSRPDPELHAKSGLVYLHWPIAGNVVPHMSREYIRFISDHMSEGYKVLVHCEAGVNRSVWLVAKLLARYNDLSGNDALERVQERISRVNIRSGLLVDLEATP